MNELKQIPDGEYIGRLIGLEVKVSKNRHKHLEWRICIESGTEAGKTIIKRNFVTSPKSVEFMKIELERIGLKTETAHDIAKKKHAVLNKHVRFLAQNMEGSSPNYYIQELLPDEQEVMDLPEDLW